mmetsp:Transcript_37588/g.85339  ORF Transcript_37588/g.85339 Transcript_37588/m.85339 type:complete len:203 (-) Transcript_37588:220-828(-)
MPNEWHCAGNRRAWTARLYSDRASLAGPSNWPNWRANLGTLPSYRPRRSWKTCTWPDVPTPAPMPMVGMESSFVTSWATGAGTISSTMPKQPASCSSRAAARSSSACSAVRPCTLYPPRAAKDCGVKPMCPMTATPAATSALTCGTIWRPPSSLTASTRPSFTRRTPLRAASSAVRYEPNGRSPMTSARFVPRAAAWQWCTI